MSNVGELFRQYGDIAKKEINAACDAEVAAAVAPLQAELDVLRPQAQEMIGTLMLVASSLEADQAYPNLTAAIRRLVPAPPPAPPTESTDAPADGR